MTIKPPDRAAITDALDDLEDKLRASLLMRQGLAFDVLGDQRDREKWLAARMATIGASESAIVLGCSPWGSPVSLWANKTGRVQRNDIEQEYQLWGRHLEDGICSGYGELTGRTAMPFGLLLRSTKFPWMSATPDALVTDEPSAAKHAPQIGRTIGHLRTALKRGADTTKLTAELCDKTRGWWPLQIKNIGFDSAEHWIDGLPDYYDVQCRHEAIVWGARKVTGAALIAGQRCAWDDLDVDLDGIVERQIVNLTRLFMRDHVDADVQPKVDGSSHTNRALRDLYPFESEGKILMLGHDAMNLAYELDEKKEQVKSAQADVSLLDNQIRDLIRDAERVVFPDGSGYTYKRNRAGSRTLLRKEPPKEKRT